MTPRRVRKSLQNGPREATETERESSDLFCSFFAPLGRLLGRSWRAPGAVLAPLGPLLARLGALLGVILASRRPPFGASWPFFSGAGEKTQKP